MPVTFKVPKSPKRDKFVVDQFHGVDFTNAGINVDPTRSPNAPNMIRHVPGKVRKRMGYSKEILFSPSRTNVNFASAAKTEKAEYWINDDNVGQWIEITGIVNGKLSEDGSDFNIYIEFDSRSDDNFYIYKSTYEIPASAEWTHHSLTIPIDGRYIVNSVKIKSLTKQSIYIKHLAVMIDKDSNYKWSPSPMTWAQSTAFQTVNGAHSLISYETGVKDMTNVNRCTSNTEIVATLDDTWYTVSSDVLRERVWRNDYIKRRIYVEFDYSLSGTSDAKIAIAGTTCGTYITPSVTPAHFSANFATGSYTNKSIQMCLADVGVTGQIRITKLFIGYAIDENYQYHTAPSGIEYTASLYHKGERNLAEITDYYNSWTATGTEFLDIATISTVGGEPTYGFCYLSFDLECTVSASGATGEVIIYDSGNYTVETGTVTYNGVKHFEFYTASTSPSRFVDRIGIRHTYSSSQSVTVANRISNIQLKPISPRYVFNNNNSARFNVLHVGDEFWLKASDNDKVQLLYSGANNQKSWSTQFGQSIIILDGQEIYQYSGGQTSMVPLSSRQCYTPLITINKNPEGGGHSYEPLNMLQPGFYEQFYVSAEKASTKEFHLSFGNLDSTTVKAWTLDSNGNWVPKIQGTHFSVNRTTGVVTFVTAPGASPILGEDNVRILAYRTVKGYRERIAHCRFGAVYGLYGKPEQLFLGGNPDFPSTDFFSKENDPTYFPDTNYSSLGSGSGDIVGYVYIGNYLGTLKREADNARSLILREGELQATGSTVDGTVTTSTYSTIFKVVNSLQGEGAISPWAIGYLETEPLYLTKSGIFAVTTQDVTGNKYGQNRSFYINEKLKEEANLEEAYATVYNNMYILAVNGHLYVLDGLQPARTTEGDPYSIRQYSAFYCDGIPATCIWNDGDSLWFGTADGKICKFHNDPASLESYNDDGYAYSAWWETPDLDGYLFYKNKTFRYFAARMMRAFRSSCKLWAEKQSVWSFIKEDARTMLVFDFENIDFERFSFSTDWSERVIHTKLRVKKVDKARFKIENSSLNEPFGIYDLALEYLESGNYKR